MYKHFHYITNSLTQSKSKLMVFLVLIVPPIGVLVAGNVKLLLARGEAIP